MSTKKVQRTCWKLSSNVSKTLERCARDNLYHHASGLISNEQHGFLEIDRVSYSSCPSSIPSGGGGGDLDRNIQTDILYLDFAKVWLGGQHHPACEVKVVWSNRQIAELVCWLYQRSPPKSRCRRCGFSVDTWCSSRKYTSGPMHFTIFMNDLPNFVTDESQTALYADDSKVYENIFTYSMLWKFTTIFRQSQLLELY